jgi:hypothetical protein
MATDPSEMGTKAAQQFTEKEYINGIFLAVWVWEREQSKTSPQN